MKAENPPEFATPHKVISVLQPGYLPYPGFFELMARCDTFVIYDDVQFDKHSWRNRNRIKGPNGPIWLTVPVCLKGNFGQLIKDVQINNATNWGKKHFESINQSYRKATYYDVYIDFFRRLFEKQWNYLIDIDLEIINKFKELLGISAELVLSSSLRVEGAKTERLIQICSALDADAYISTNGAKTYLDVTLFERVQVYLTYQDFSMPGYPQLHGEFVSYMSFVDMLFNVGPGSGELILQNTGCPFNVERPYRGLKPTV